MTSWNSKSPPKTTPLVIVDGTGLRWTVNTGQAFEARVLDRMTYSSRQGKRPLVRYRVELTADLAVTNEHDKTMKFCAGETIEVENMDGKFLSIKKELEPLVAPRPRKSGKSRRKRLTCNRRSAQMAVIISGIASHWCDHRDLTLGQLLGQLSELEPDPRGGGIVAIHDMLDETWEKLFNPLNRPIKTGGKP